MDHYISSRIGLHASDPGGSCVLLVARSPSPGSGTGKSLTSEPLPSSPTTKASDARLSPLPTDASGEPGRVRTIAALRKSAPLAWLFSFRSLARLFAGLLVCLSARVLVRLIEWGPIEPIDDVSTSDTDTKRTKTATIYICSKRVRSGPAQRPSSSSAGPPPPSPLRTRRRRPGGTPRRGGGLESAARAQSLSRDAHREYELQAGVGKVLAVMFMCFDQTQRK